MGAFFMLIFIYSAAAMSALTHFTSQSVRIG